MTFSHYPALPFPFEAELPVSHEEACAYLPHRQSRFRAFAIHALSPAFYHGLMNCGFRRSGDLFYQPVCRGCRKCVPIRVPVNEFTPSRSQRRLYRRNADLTLETGPIDYRAEEFELYRRYSREWHGRDVSDHDYLAFLVHSPVDTIAFRYRDAAGRLLAVGVCDRCPLSLSSVYFFFEPAEAVRSLGTFGALMEIAWAARENIPHYYLGYWIEGSPAMDYKCRFRPYELLGTDGIWRRAGTDD